MCGKLFNLDLFIVLQVFTLHEHQNLVNILFADLKIISYI